MISIIRDNSSDNAEYLGQMLSLWGLACWKVIEQEKMRYEFASTAILLADVDISLDLIKDYIAAGGHAILVTPDRKLLAGLGIDYPAHYSDDRKTSYMRMVRPLLSAFSHYSLPIVGNRMGASRCHYSGNCFEIMPPPGARISAYMFETDGGCNDRPAIWSIPVKTGVLTVFTYDIVECFKLLRQGRPEYANWRPDFDDICRPEYLFGPNWMKEFHSQHLPLADFHPMMLVRIIEENLSIPVPRFWQLPGFNHSAILISGDEDGAPPEYTKEQTTFLDKIGGNLTMYIMVQSTKSSLEDLQDNIDRGHSFSVHPYPICSKESESCSTDQGVAKIENCVKDFQLRYNLPTRIIRNHRLYWEGYLDIPRLWEKLGVEMDTNYVSASLSGKDFGSFFASPAGVLPIYFLDEQNKIITVLQQPVGAMDTLEFNNGKPQSWNKQNSPEMFDAYCNALVSNILKPLGIPFAFIFHPGNFCTFAREHSQRFLLKAHEHGTALISDYDWLDFWQMRKGWKIIDFNADGSKIRYKLEGKTTTNQKLSITLPCHYNDREMREITIDGTMPRLSKITHFGEQRVLVELPGNTKEIELKINY